MILLLVFQIYLAPSLGTRDLSRIDLNDNNDACASQRGMKESQILLGSHIDDGVNMTLEKLRDLEKAIIDTSGHRAFKRVKRQNRRTTLSPEQRYIRDEIIRIKNLKEKALHLMEQAMYAAQEVLWPLEPIFKKYENDVPYRMAFIFGRLHVVMREAKSIIKVIERKRVATMNTTADKWSPTMRLQLYWQLMRRNMDATFLVDYIIQRVPLGTEGKDTTPAVPITPASNTTTTTSGTNSTTTNATTTTSAPTATTSKRRLRNRFRKRFTVPYAGYGDDKWLDGIGNLGMPRNIPFI